MFGCPPPTDRPKLVYFCIHFVVSVTIQIGKKKKRKKDQPTLPSIREVEDNQTNKNLQPNVDNKMLYDTI